MFLSVVISCIGYLCLHFVLFPVINDGARIAEQYNRSSVTLPPGVDAKVFGDAVAMAKAASFAKVLAIFCILQNMLVLASCILLFCNTKQTTKSAEGI